MNPAVIEGWQHAPGAPEDWEPEKHGPCGALPIRVDNIEGMPFMKSAWQPTPGEIAAIAAGSTVELGICSSAHPVVNMGVGPLPADDTGKRVAYVVTREESYDGAVWCRVLALIGPHRFPAGMEITNPNKPNMNAVDFADASQRLIGAVEIHARTSGWID